MIDPRALAHPWPSTQAASQMIVERSGERLRLLALRERLAIQFEQVGRAA